jgi:hypothetical protein
MWKCDSLAQAGATEPLPFNELCENFFICNIRIRVRKQFAQNLKTVFFAARMHIAEHTAGADDLFQYHER